MKTVIKFSKRSQSYKKNPVDYMLGRKEMELMAKFSKPYKLSNFSQENIENVKIEWISGSYINNDNQNKVILYFHGGGYYCGNIESHRSFASYLSFFSNTKVLLVEYSLAPENPFPAALNDVLLIYRWLLNKKNIAPENIVILGDSAGGGLLFSLLLKSKELNLPLPSAAVAISPWVDLTCSGESTITKQKDDPVLEYESMKSAVKLYLNGENPENPYASSLFGDLTNLPPVLIIVGTREILLSDSIRIAEKLEKCNVNVELDIWEDMIHDFPLYPPKVPEAKEAMEKIAEFIKKRLNIN